MCDGVLCSCSESSFLFLIESLFEDNASNNSAQEIRSSSFFFPETFFLHVQYIDLVPTLFVLCLDFFCCVGVSVCVCKEVNRRKEPALGKERRYAAATAALSLSMCPVTEFTANVGLQPRSTRTEPSMVLSRTVPPPCCEISTP